MEDWLIYSIGFIAQILFSSRLILQWVSSERKGKVTIPKLFWTLSLLASFLLFIYGYLRLDFTIMLGQSLTYFIYVRNLQLQNQWQKLPKSIQYTLYFTPVFIIIIYCANNHIDFKLFFANEAMPLWLLTLGIVAQIIFTFRFIYQWVFAERRKESLLPLGFWLLSLFGALLILSYATIRKDPVLFVGHLFGLIIYARNVYLIWKVHG